MKALIMFSLFVITYRRSNAVEFREQPFQPGTDEIICALNKCSRLEGFNDQLKINDEITSVFAPEQNTFVKALVEVKLQIEIMDDILMEGISEYFQKLIYSYLIEAHGFVSGQSNSDVHRDVGIGDHAFCVVSFLTGFGYNDSVVLHTVSFLQTIRFNRIAPADLKEMLLKFSYNFKPESTNDELLDTDEVLSLPAAAGTAKSLNVCKEEVKTFSNTFCLSTIQPLVDKDFFEPQQHIDRDQFIDYVFRVELCFIYVSIIKFII